MTVKREKPEIDDIIKKLYEVNDYLETAYYSTFDQAHVDKGERNLLVSAIDNVQRVYNSLNFDLYDFLGEWDVFNYPKEAMRKNGLDYLETAFALWKLYSQNTVIFEYIRLDLQSDGYQLPNNFMEWTKDNWLKIRELIGIQLEETKKSKSVILSKLDGYEYDEMSDKMDFLARSFTRIIEVMDTQIRSL